MKDEIKEILDDLLFTTALPNVSVKLSEEKLNQLKDYITNLQKIAEEHKNCTRKHWQQKCAEHYANEMIYKSRCEKAIQREMELSYLCDTPPDEELLNILQGEDNIPENLYKYTPEKGFRRVEDEW